MKVASNDFNDNQFLETLFTRDGSNYSPEIHWWNAPSNTKSYALICNDPDAPGGNFVHWAVINIPSNINSVPKYGPAVGKTLTNDFGYQRYDGPCPPPGKPHRYVFTVYALDVEDAGDVNPRYFYDSIKKYVIDSAQITGIYERK